MKKTVWTYGLISGGIAAVLMLCTLPFVPSMKGRTGEVVGYTGIVLSGLLVFFGIRSYRENVGGGRISFLRGLAVGSLIALISACCYVATWELVYWVISPGLGDKLFAGMVENIKASGKPQAEIDAAVAQMQWLSEAYKNPILNALITFVEPLPIGLLIAVVSAAILRKRQAGFQAAAGS